MGKLKRIKWDEGGTAQNVKRHLPALVTDYFIQGRQTVARKPTPSQFHALRLRTKHLRYTLEMFRPCYGPGFRVRIAALRRLQQCLGVVNDCATAAGTLARLSRKDTPQRDRLDRFLQQRSVAKIEEFRHEWTKVFDAPGRERWWSSYLTRQARRTAPGRKH